MRYIYIVLLAAAFTACKANSAEQHNGHDGHDHAAEQHDHEAEGGHDHEKEESHAGEIVFTKAQAAAAGLEIEEVSTGGFAQSIRASGIVQSPVGDEQVVAAPQSGLVTLNALTEGAPVAKGVRIASISARGIEGGDPAAQARIELQAAENAYKRAETLAKDNIVSKKDLEEARRRYDAAQNAMPRAANTAAAPIGGFIKNILVQSGEYVSVGQPIATVAASSTLQLRAEVSERYFGALSNIRSANFKLSYNNKVYHADRLVSRGRTANNFLVPVIFEFSNVGDVVAGASAEVWLLGAPEEGVLSVPRGALTEEQGVWFVYVQLDEEGFEKREVSVGADNGERVAITAGLHEGERVVTHGAMQVRLAAMSGIIPEGHSHNH